MTRKSMERTITGGLLLCWLLLACRPLLTPTALPTKPPTGEPRQLPDARSLTPLASIAPTGAATPLLATATPTRLVPNTPTAAPPTRLVPSTPSAAPATQAVTISERDLGAPGVGDAYNPADLAVDAQRNLAYVYCTRGPDQRPVLAVIDLAQRQVARLWPLTPLTGQSGGHLLLTPDGAAAFVIDSEAEVLVSLDPLNGQMGRRLDDVRTAALSADGEMLFVANGQSVRAYRRAALAASDNPTPLWSQNVGQIDGLALNGDRLLVSRSRDEGQLQLRAAANGQVLAEALLPDHYSSGLTALPDGGWAVRTNGLTPQVQRFDGDLRQVMTATVPSGSGLFFDAPRARLLLSGYRYDSVRAPGGEVIIQALDATALTVQTQAAWPDEATPDLFAPVGKSAVLALARYGVSRLNILDNTTLQPSARLIVGVRLLDMALDEARAMLYVADDQERIHLVNLTTGRAQALWQGQAPLALDKVNRRLYVNRPQGVVSLNADTGALIAAFPQGGAPAADPARDRVYIARSGVTVYTRAGVRVDELKATFATPQGLVPNPSAYSVRVNPVSGYVLALMNNGVPGSNNSSYLQLFAPDSQQPISVPGFFSFVTDLVFATNGDTYVSYSIARNQEAIQWLGPSGQERGRLAGLSGRLALDEKGSTLWASFGASLAAVQTGPFMLQGFKLGPAQAEQIVFDDVRRQFYARFQESPRLAIAPLSGLLPLTVRPQALAAYPADGVNVQDLAVDPAGRWFYINAGSTVYRTPDNRRWERLDFGQTATYGYLTVTATGVLFHTGVAGADGGVGVYRSQDGGATWELLAAGLADLRGAQPIVARSADEAYFMSKTAGLYAWQPAARRWQQIMAPDNAYSALGTLALAPDGALFLANYDRMRRSQDRGASWSEVKMPAASGVLLGFATNYTATQTVFGLFGSEPPRLFRSSDAGRTWTAVGANLKLPAFASGFELLPAADVLYLYRSDYAGQSELFRSLDNGDTWQAAPADVARGTVQAALAPDGRLWFTRQGGLQGVAPGDLRWLALP